MRSMLQMMKERKEWKIRREGAVESDMVIEGKVE